MTRMVRADVVAELARRWRVRENVAADRIDAVLDVVLRMAGPKLERAGGREGEVLITLREWRGGVVEPEAE
jgi:hypothetical protein